MDCPLFPVGRLDYDAEGLIFITNDGDFAQQISHPKYKFKKSYFVKIDKILDEKELKILNKKMFIEEKIYKAKVNPLRQSNKKSWVKVDLYQGLNLQIKKMFWHLKIQVLKIKRFQIGNIHLADLKSGQYRLLKKRKVGSKKTGVPASLKIVCFFFNKPTIFSAAKISLCSFNSNNSFSIFHRLSNLLPFFNSSQTTKSTRFKIC